jgi:protein-tyrosine phosphatase
MTGYIDLHCHWVAEIDDGAPTIAEGIEMLRVLRSIGFETAIGTPHLRPGLFDTKRADLQAAFTRMLPEIESRADLPKVALAAEHYFEDTVFFELLQGQGLPYPGDRAALLEFPADGIPARIADRLFDLRRKGIRPVIAHPERCAPVWKRPETMEELVDRGTVLLMDVAALAGKYGRTVRRCAETLLEAGLYYAVCSDAHRVTDLSAVAEGLARLRKTVGDSEADFLLIDGPGGVLAGKVDL